MKKNEFSNKQNFKAENFKKFINIGLISLFFRKEKSRSMQILWKENNRLNFVD